MSNEIGTIIGAVVLGALSDYFSSKRARLSAVIVILGTIVMIFLTVSHKTMCSTFVFFTIGLLLGGINHIISVTCACDLGYHSDGKPS
jgi:sugar phosphate permease